MTKLTKKKKQLLELVNPETTYSLDEAMTIFQTVKSPKFDESIDIALRLGIDAGKSDQNVRGAITLPHSLGKAVSVAVFADGDQAKEATDAGADFVGLDDLAEKFKKEEISVDVVISTQAAMKVVGQLGQVLGPKGLMPNPKTGTVTEKVGDAIKNANMLQKDRDAGQMSFFDSFDENHPEETIVTLPDVPPWPKRDMLMEEKKVLGMYVTDHPLADHATAIDTYSTANTATMRNMQPKAEVLIGGMISRCRFMVTKNGRGAGSRMAIITVEDLQGSVEAVLFPDCFALHEELIVSDRMVFIKGQLDFRRDDPSVRINAVYDMERAAEELTHAVFANLAEENVTSTQIEAFKDICKTFPGTTPVYVNVVTERKITVAIQIDKGVRPTKQFCQKIEQLLGTGTLKCTGPGTQI